MFFFSIEPWLGRKKKPVKKKKAASPKKKPSTTQDKIETMFERKNSAASAATVTVTTAAGHSLTGTPVGTNGLYLGERGRREAGEWCVRQRWRLF